ncbi:MAG: hypothetical protein WBD41_28025 [Rhodococcus sp. (in: high G+C Gram-positive bacteria)]
MPDYVPMMPPHPNDAGREEDATAPPDRSTAPPAPPSATPDPDALDLLHRARLKQQEEVGKVVRELSTIPTDIPKQLAFGALRKLGSEAMQKFLDVISDFWSS